MGKTVCVFSSASQFNNLLNATKDFVSKNPARPLQQYLFLIGETVREQGQEYDHKMLTTLALDGYRMSKETLTGLTYLDEFKGYLSVPRFKPHKGDTVSIEQEPDKSLTLCYKTPERDKITMNTPRPMTDDLSGESQHEKFWKQVSEMTGHQSFYVGLNGKYLSEMAASMTDCFTSNHRQPVILTGGSPLTAIRLQTSPYSQRVLLPVRTSVPDNVASQQPETIPPVVYGVYSHLPNATVHNADGDAIGEPADELLSLHLTNNLALKAMVEEEARLEKACKDCDCDRPRLWVKPISLNRK